MTPIAYALSVLFTLAALTAEPDSELTEFQGVWVIAEASLAGRDHLDDFKGMTLTVTDSKYQIDFKENSDKGALKIDATKKPKQIDLTTSRAGPFKGRTLPGIYEFKGGTVVLCLNSEKPDRPSAFEAKEKTPIMLLTFRREKK
ncbi:TIGR03067 domain-containing protein [Frigoriglobus tundricola]|uniref:TIGR03067 domain-containing protein n=1 Tax=Frigoriglobus tundricola TaxID=2774151 RepID=A0A6M5YT89_9BACT|nr:TIGR03067 domain-containing protein [Frigoriglobus tundricola]QJW96152.1 hypothetical protein FTUN_3708 [Frigoriglobus tundricola]